MHRLISMFVLVCVTIFCQCITICAFIIGRERRKLGRERRKLTRTSLVSTLLAILLSLIVTGNLTAQTSISQFSDLAKVVSPINRADLRAVTWKLSELMSFAYYPATANTPLPPTERLYLPIRSQQLTGDPRLGYDQAAGAILSYLDQLAMAQPSNLSRAAQGARVIYLDRFKIGASNQFFGNTPDTSFAQFGAFLRHGMDNLNEFEQERERDKQRSGNEEALPSLESLRKLQTFMNSMTADGLSDVIREPAKISGLLAYADYASVDRQTAYWQNTLLPLLNRTAGPVQRRQLVDVGGSWRPKGGRNQFYRLDHFTIRNVSNQALNHVAVELVAQNQWGETATHYYFFPTMAVSESFRLLPHPRWNKRRLDFTNSITLTYSVMADSGRDLGRQTRLTNPMPNPDPNGWRSDYLRFDNQYAAIGESLGQFMSLTYPQPITK
jgi:hypothetical protein